MNRQTPAPLEQLSAAKLEVCRGAWGILSEKQGLIMWGLAEGYTKAEIARILSISKKTYANHILRIESKLSMQNGTSSVMTAIAARTKPDAPPPAPFNPLPATLLEQCRKASGRLSLRERQIFIRLGEGYGTGDIAVSLHISKSNVGGTLKRLQTRLGVVGQSISMLTAIAARVTHEPALHAEAQVPAKRALSHREEQVIRGLAEGYSNSEIACRLGLSNKTVSTYKSRIRDKLLTGKNL